MRVVSKLLLAVLLVNWAISCQAKSKEAQHKGAPKGALKSTPKGALKSAPTTVIQKVRFPAPPVKLYELYMDEKLHFLTTGKKATVKKEIGSHFSAYNGYITGKILHFVPGKMIVQTWRGKSWNKTDEDSILVLIFRKSGNETELELIQANVPQHFAKGLASRWGGYYWKKWKEHIKKGAHP